MVKTIEKAGFCALTLSAALQDVKTFHTQYLPFLLTFGPHNFTIILGHESEVNPLPEKKKMGRPTDNPKGASLHVRLDQECEHTLQLYCAQENVPKTEAIRRGIKKLKDDLKK